MKHMNSNWVCTVVVMGSLQEYEVHYKRRISCYVPTKLS